MVAAIAALPKPGPLQKSLICDGFSKRFNFEQVSERKKRNFNSLVVASGSKSSSKGGSERFYLNFTGFPFPLGPFLNRITIRTEVSFSLCSFDC